jgi:hypothetical protein
MRREHTHDCQRCGRKMRCGGELERNYDGFPEVICTRFHVIGHDICDECDELLAEETRRENAEVSAE